MATQYIGARYVPTFYRNPNGGTDWNSTVTYDPLTIVTYGGYSYTSRRFVPVGIEITNNEYWALTGNFNGQVQVYVEAVNDLAADVAEIKGEIGDVPTPEEIAALITAALQNYATTDEVDAAIEEALADFNPSELPENSRYLPGLKDKFIVFIGDSLSAGTYTNNYSWCNAIENAYGGNTKVLNLSVGGRSLISGTGKSIIDNLPGMLTSINAELAARQESIPYAVVIQAGANDQNANAPIGSRARSNKTTTTFWGAMNYIKDEFLTRYPQTHVCFMACPVRKSNRNTLGLSEMDYSRATLDFGREFSIPVFDTQGESGVDLLNGSAYGWARANDPTYGATHYSVAAYDFIAPKIANFLVNGGTGSPMANYIDTLVSLSMPSSEIGARMNQYREVRFTGGYKICWGRIDNMTVNCDEQVAIGIYRSDLLTIPLPTGFSETANPVIQVTATTFGTPEPVWFVMAGVPTQASTEFTGYLYVNSTQALSRSFQLYITIFTNT